MIINYFLPQMHPAIVFLQFFKDIGNPRVILILISSQPPNEV